MSKSGHAITAFALGSVIFAAQPTIAGALTAVGAIVGASVPDSLEIPEWEGGQRRSVIPHRTLTHWLPVWFLCALLAEHIAAPWSHLLFGLALSAALHILIDSLSPMGIPIVNPFRRQPLRNAVYRTGKASELPFIIVSLVITGGAFISRGPEMLHALRFL
jgi:inner membrane protein